eukprot:m.43104 g.43104  ORF g.43104 m.43104 type:complete len:437 (+) comp19302_c0_seq2:1387-2697(+)
MCAADFDMFTTGASRYIKHCGKELKAGQLDTIHAFATKLGKVPQNLNVESQLKGLLSHDEDLLKTVLRYVKSGEAWDKCMGASNTGEFLRHLSKDMIEMAETQNSPEAKTLLLKEVKGVLQSIETLSKALTPTPKPTPNVDTPKSDHLEITCESLTAVIAVMQLGEIGRPRTSTPKSYGGMAFMRTVGTCYVVDDPIFAKSFAENNSIAQEYNLYLNSYGELESVIPPLSFDGKKLKLNISDLPSALSYFQSDFEVYGSPKQKDPPWKKTDIHTLAKLAFLGLVHVGVDLAQELPDDDWCRLVHCPVVWDWDKLKSRPSRQSCKKLREEIIEFEKNHLSESTIKLLKKKEISVAQVAAKREESLSEEKRVSAKEAGKYCFLFDTVVEEFADRGDIKDLFSHLSNETRTPVQADYFWRAKAFILGLKKALLEAQRKL